MIGRILRAVADGHLVAIRPHHCRFGDTYQPFCEDCDYIGPFVTKARANAIALEHFHKAAGIWEAAR